MFVEVDGVHGFDVYGVFVKVVGGDIEFAQGVIVVNHVFLLAVDGVVEEVGAVPFPACGVVDDAGAGDAVDEAVGGVVDIAVELIHAEKGLVVAFGIDLHPLFVLKVDVAEILLMVGVDVGVFKFDQRLVVDRDEEVAEGQDDEGYEDGSVEVGAEHTPVADAAAQDGDYFGVACHLRGEENHADEDEQGAVEVHKTRDEIEVIIKDDRPKGGVTV